MLLQLVVDKNTPNIVEAFSTLGDVRAIETSAFSRESVKDADAIIVRSEVKVGAALLEGSRVRFVGTTTIGTDHLDESWLQERGIAYANAPGCNANSVCEYVLAALLVLANRKGIRLRGSSIGIVGVGNVGSRVRNMATTIGMKVILNDPPLERLTGDAKYRPLAEVLEADFVTMHVPLTRSGPDATVHLFDERRIASLRKEAFLINTSRGPVVDNRALEKVLRERKLGGAVLDVWENEPNFESGLLDRVDIGTPHIAGYSLDGKTNAVSMVYRAFCSTFLLEPRWALDVEKLPRPETKEVILSPGWQCTDQELDDLIRKCYDILADDRALREVCASPAGNRGTQFQKLRTGYRVRREFRATTVRGATGENAELLRALGFNVAM